MKVIKFDGNVYSVDSFMKYVGSHNFIMMERGMASTVNAKHAEPTCIDESMRVQVHDMASAIADAIDNAKHEKPICINGTMYVQVHDMASAIADAIDYCGNGDWFSIAMAIEPLFGIGLRTYKTYEVTVYDLL